MKTTLNDPAEQNNCGCVKTPYTTKSVQVSSTGVGDSFCAHLLYRPQAMEGHVIFTARVVSNINHDTAGIEGKLLKTNVWPKQAAISVSMTLTRASPCSSRYRTMPSHMSETAIQTPPQSATSSGDKTFRRRFKIAQDVAEYCHLWNTARAFGSITHSDVR